MTFNPKILVAVSGGPDSTALLHFLKHQGFDVAAAHLNHKIRGSDAERDALFVKQLCKEMRILLIVQETDVPSYSKKNKLSMEDAARFCRYKFLEKTANRLGCNIIAVGHNADDNVETFLMNLIRGAGLRGLSGIPPLREIPISKSQIPKKLQNTNSKIVIARPLLNIWRKDILKYCKKHKLKYRIDKTNFDTKYFRNMIRHKVVPKIDKEKISALIKKISEQHSLIKKIAASELEPNGLRSGFLNLPDFLKSHVIRAAIEKAKGNLVDIEAIHIRNILDQLGKTESWTLNLPDGIIASGNRGKLTISKGISKKQAGFKYKLKVPGMMEIPECGVKIETRLINISKPVSNKVIFRSREVYSRAVFDYSKTGKGLYVRNWKHGDRFKPLGMKGTKKLSDYFIDQKYSLEEKNITPIIVTSKDQIVCVGARIDKRFKIDSATKTFLNLL